MKKMTLAIIAATTLSACVGGSDVTVSQGDALTTSCGITHMQTMNGLPMRCGPQSMSPYTMR